MHPTAANTGGAGASGDATQVAKALGQGFGTHASVKRFLSSAEELLGAGDSSFHAHRNTPTTATPAASQPSVSNAAMALAAQVQIPALCYYSITA